MDPRQLVDAASTRSPAFYVAVGMLSLAKAIVLRHDRARFRRELLDAGLFLGVGVLLSQLTRDGAESEPAVRGRLPEWAERLVEPPAGRYA